MADKARNNSVIFPTQSQSTSRASSEGGDPFFLKVCRDDSCGDGDGDGDVDNSSSGCSLSAEDGGSYSCSESSNSERSSEKIDLSERDLTASAYEVESSSTSYSGSSRTPRSGTATMDDSSCDESTTSYSSSNASDDYSSYDSDSYDSSEYDDLMAGLPLALDRQGMLPVPKKCAPLAIPELQDPAEGLAMFQNIRADLERVGRYVKIVPRRGPLDGCATGTIDVTHPFSISLTRKSLIIEKKEEGDFVQRAHVLSSINWLAANLPTSVLDHLGNEIRESLDVKERQEGKDERFRSVNVTQDLSEASDLSESNHPGSPMKKQKNFYPCKRKMVQHQNVDRSKIPFVDYFQGALLFADISGFTFLSTVLGPEVLSKVINSYFQLIVDKIIEFGGDVQHYVGDALFAEWRVTPTFTMEQCVEAAAACCVSMVKGCADFPVVALAGMNSSASPDATLNVHCGLGVGELIGFHVGDSKYRREYMYLGDPLIQATDACAQAGLGEVVASEKFRVVLARLGMLSSSDSATQKVSPFVVASRDTANVRVPQNHKWIDIDRVNKSRGVTALVDGLPVDALKEYRRLMSLYVHPVAVKNDIAASRNFRSSPGIGTDQEKRQEDAELRSVYVMFINPLVELKLSGDSASDIERIELINKIMIVVTRELNHHVGHLDNCIVDDKGLVLIASFGLRGSAFPGMVTERALPATLAVREALLVELGVNSKIGATFGDLYCGAVGSQTRQEYSFLGPSCNLAARLMGSQKNPGVLVDDAVRKIAARFFCFNALDPVKAKGYKDPVSIFEPLAPREYSWGRIEANFVGRRGEIQRLTKMARDMIKSDSSPSMLTTISGSSGMGKSTLLAHSIEHIRRIFGVRQGLVVATHGGRECDSMVPFSTVRKLLFKMLATFNYSRDDHTSVPLCPYADDQSLSCGSICSASTLSKKYPLETFAKICDELELDQGLVERLRHDLLDYDPDGSQRLPRNTSRQPMASLIAQIIARCSAEVELVLIAIDDIHLTDENSWIVLREILETASNVLIVGSYHSAVDLSRRVEEEFWSKLNESYLENGRFVQIKIDRLTEEDIVSMTMKSLKLQRKDVTPDLINEVLVPSGGMPHFASKILEGIRVQQSSVVLPDAKSHSAINEICLHRIDSFDVSVRSILNFAAVLGNSFSLKEILSVLRRSSEGSQADFRRLTIESLQFLVDEGVLLEGETSHERLLPRAPLVDDDTTTLTFFQDVWRATVLRLMLGSRKRDVHRKIAQSMEAMSKDTDISIEYTKKLFSHWSDAGDKHKITSMALEAGLSRALWGDLELLRMYDDSLKSWGWNASYDKHPHGGFSKRIVDLLGPTDLSCIISLFVAQGNTLALCARHKESMAAYENALRLKEGSRAFSDMSDRSVIFPALNAICDGIANGHVEQDVFRSYEQGIIYQFLKETKDGHRLHRIHALYLQMVLFGELGSIDKAVAVHSIIRELYIPEKHSKRLRKAYGKDGGALSFTLCAFLEIVRKRRRDACSKLRHFLKEVYPKIETDFTQSITMIFQLTLVLKEIGLSAEALCLFNLAIIQPFQDVVEDSAHFLSSMCEPLALLLELASQTRVSEDSKRTFIQRTTGDFGSSRSFFDSQTNLFLARLGCCGDSIVAEIYARLAAQLPEGCKVREDLLFHGRRLTAEAMMFVIKHRLQAATTQLYTVQARLENLGHGSGATYDPLLYLNARCVAKVGE